MSLTLLIDQATQVYAAAGLDCGNGLLPPLDTAAIDALAQALALPLPPELRELYTVHGGQEYVAAATDTDCIGETSMYWISDGGRSSVSAW